MKNLWTWVALVIVIGLGIWWYSAGQPDATTDGMVNNTVDESTTPGELAYKDVSPSEAKALIDNTKNLVVLDVSNKYAEGHLPGAINYYVGDGSLDKAIPSLTKNVPYLVYCHVDSASISGAQKLIDAGFKEVYRLSGNYAGWVAAGYEVVK